MISRTTSLIPMLLLLAACSDFSGRPSMSVGADENRAAAVSGGVDFATVRSRLFVPSCVTCHRQYSSYGAVKTDLSKITNAIEAGRMPLGGPAVPDEVRRLLREWAGNGAPEHGDASAGPAPPSSAEPNLEPTWASVSEKILFPKCVLCHNPQGQAKFLDLSTRNALFRQRERVFADGRKLLDFDAPEKSYFLEVIQDPDEPMPPKWANLGRLSDVEVKTLSDWIAQGLP